MTDRIPLTDLTSDALDQLYNRLEGIEAENSKLRAWHERCPDREPRARAEDAVARIRAAAARADHAATQATNDTARAVHEGWASGLREALRLLGAPAAGQPEPATINDPEWLRQQYTAAIRSCVEDGNVRYEHLADAVMRVRDRHLAQLRQRVALADEILTIRDAELVAAKKAARGIGAWGVLQAIEQVTPPAHDAGPTVAEAAAQDRRWPLEKHGE
jgi:hypothetical protein